MKFKYRLKTSIYTKHQRQLYDEASNSVLIENNGVSLDMGWSRFLSDTVVVNKNSIASITAE